MSLKKNKKPRVSSASRKLIALATMVALTASLPAAAFADKSVNSSVASGSPSTPATTTSTSGSATADPAQPASSEGVEVAEAAITKAKAVELARKYLAIPDGYTLQSSRLSTDLQENGLYIVWNLSFVNKINGKVKGSINAGLDGTTGELLSYYSSIDNPNAKPSYPPKVNREKASEVALAFLNNVAPGYVKQVELDAYVGVGAKPPLSGQVIHSLRYDRIVNGVPYVQNYIDFEIDGEGHIVSYQLNWERVVSFEKAKAGFTLDEAIAKISASAKPALSYIVPYQSKTRKPVLVYNMPPLAISAVTGNPIDSQQVKQTETQLSAKPSGTKPVAGKEALTKEQASAKVEAAFGLPDNAKLSSADFSEYANDNGKARASWQLSYTIDADKKEGRSIWAEVDAWTGEVRSYSAYNASSRTGLGVTYDQAKATALKVLQNRVPWLADQYYLVEGDTSRYEGKKPEEIGEYYFGAVRKVHGAVAEGDSLQVSVNAFDGTVTSYWSYSEGYEYPAQAPTVIGDSKAITAWMDFYRVELTYQSNYSYYWNGDPIPVEKYKTLIAAGEAKPSELEAKGEAKLVYRLVPRYVLDQSVTLDAQTGKWINTEDGTAASLERPLATDIDGHWAQRELDLMVAYKALDLKDGKVNPNAVITRGEMIKMLVLAMNQGSQPPMYAADEKATASFGDVTSNSQYFAYVEAALGQQLIDIGDGTFDPDGKVDREEMAELIVRALGFNALAEHNGLFKVTFKDAAKTKQQGQAAIAVGLGIMSLQNGYFLPERQVTRAEAAAAFFRFLQARADLQEAPLRN
ncbi:S-layer homology domain-containing protein [Paenibacillus sp. MMS18-CY102]|uniref:S-layer homology domain-containing protein n=1 Tax=Paenibacillus sp. MMS18-CY102 TaxID=2682849 RepID=UPI001365612F|nr:S-layer homology domain-containing protein [Paenibacillus sp. MMS18-CY102]